MRTFKDIVSGNGFLTDDGKQFCFPLVEALDKIYNSEELKNCSANELRTLGSTLANLLGNYTFDKLQQK